MAVALGSLQMHHPIDNSVSRIARLSVTLRRKNILRLLLTRKCKSSSLRGTTFAVPRLTLPAFAGNAHANFF